MFENWEIEAKQLCKEKSDFFIKRNGKKIFLTREEVTEAMFDNLTVVCRNSLDGILQENGLSLPEEVKKSIVESYGGKLANTVLFGARLLIEDDMK